MEDFQALLKKLGTGYVSNTAYDTAWVAQLVDFDPILSNRSLQWLCENQLPDGSWGVEQPNYYHDRIVSTIAAMIALTHRGRRLRDKMQIEKGIIALERFTQNATRELRAETYPATVGFEMIIPTLVHQAEELNIIKQQGDRILGKLGRLRKVKMDKLSGIKISRLITAAHSAEMAGRDGLSLLDTDNLQEQNGSVSNNPAATAYFALDVKPGDEKALAYLNKVASPDGGIPSFAPFDIFERVWVLWNLSLTNYKDDPEIKKICEPHIAYLEKNWKNGKGLGFSAEYSLTDGDDTSVGHEVLSIFGGVSDIDALHSYEEADHFRCYHLETNPSIDVNTHVLGALRQAGYEANHPSIKKIIAFLCRSQNKDGYWFDKWNISPYYTTSHAIIASHGINDELCENAIKWILDTQKPDGSWGFYGFSTTEETAYCIQVLAIWHKHFKKLPKGKLLMAQNWLTGHMQQAHHPLWIDKSLYCPNLVVESVILSALWLAEECK
jgi:halimadienyl-diphosphate synthase